MISVVIAAGLALDPWSLVRVDDPSYPGADARSESGAVLLEPPADGTPWRVETVPEVDGWVGQEGIEAMNVASYHDVGHTGSGIKVAVFDLLWFGSEADPTELGEVQTHDCYAHTSCDVPMDTWRPRFGFEEGVHGYACAEVIRDIAPDVELHLVRVNGVTTFENAVRWAIREQIDVISMSMSFYNDSFYDGTGVMAGLVDELVAADVLLVTSAGNSAQQHWQGTYVDRDADGRFDGPDTNGWWIYLTEGASRPVYFTWDQYHDCGTTDFDVYGLDADGHIVGRAENTQQRGADRCAPVERLRMVADRDDWYRIEVHHKRGSTQDIATKLHVRSGFLNHPVAVGSVADPAVMPAVFAVGAVRADGYLTNDVEPFSSWGPTSAGVVKPDIAGPDGISTDAYGGRGFYGTSAATPAVTGALALLMSEDPSLGPYEAARKLQALAIRTDVSFVEPDPRWGAGKAYLPGYIRRQVGCGERPLAMWLLWVPVGLLRRRSRRRHSA